MKSRTNENSSKQLKFYSKFIYVTLCVVIPLIAGMVLSLLLKFIVPESQSMSSDIELLPILAIWWSANILLYLGSLFIYALARKGKIARSKHRQLFDTGIVSLVSLALIMIAVAVFKVLS